MIRQHDGDGPMQKLVKRQLARRRTVSLALAVGASLLVAGAGCDDKRSSDKKVLEDIRQARVERVKGNADQAHSLLQQAAQVSDTSPATEAHAKSMLAQAEVENAIHLINDKESGVEAGNSEIARLLYEIGALGQQIQTSNSLVAAYQQYEPSPAQKMAEQQIASAQGGPGKATWLGEGPNALPSLSAVNEQVKSIQAEIAKLQSQIKTLQAQQTQTGQQAEQAGRQATVTQGQAGIQAEKVAADLRKKTAELANQIDVLQAKVAPLEADLAVAQARQAALTSATEQFKKLSANFAEGWKGVEQQVVRQQQLRTGIYQGVGGAEKKASTNSITQKSVELAKVIARTQESYEKAEESLTNAIDHFGQAETAAQKLQSELQSKLSSMRGTEMGKTAEALQQTFNPNTFKLGQADAQQLLATLYTSRVSALSSRARLASDLHPVLQGAGLTMPKQLDDPKLDATIKEIAKKAQEMYGTVTQTYTDVAEGTQNEQQKTAAHIGRMFAAYGHAQLARALNDTKGAQQALADARQARDLVIQDKGPQAIPAYPSELVPAAATQPVATTGPATAPTAPAPGAAKATARAATKAPAPTEEGAAPGATPGATPGAAPGATPGASPAGEGTTHPDDGGGYTYVTGPEWIELRQMVAKGRQAFQLNAEHGEGKSKGALVVQWQEVKATGPVPQPRQIGEMSFKGIASSVQGIQRMSDEATKLGDKDGWATTFVGEQNGVAVKGVAYSCAIPNEFIMVMFLTDPDSFDKELPLAQKVVTSFTWNR